MRQKPVGYAPGVRRQPLVDRLRTGAGWAVTLRTTSPQAPSVVIMVWLISAIVAFRSPLMTPWNWIACRVVIRSV